MKKSILNLTIIFVFGLFVILGCSAPKDSSSSSNSGSTNPATTNEKPIAIQAKTLTKEYDDNELAADGKYKDNMLAVSGKITDIAETLGYAPTPHYLFGAKRPPL